MRAEVSAIFCGAGILRRRGDALSRGARIHQQTKRQVFGRWNCGGYRWAEKVLRVQSRGRVGVIQRCLFLGRARVDGNGGAGVVFGASWSVQTFPLTTSSESSINSTCSP